MKENKLTRNFIITTFVLLYAITSIVSTIHVIDFFRLSNPNWLAVTLAIAFEIGAAASLASIIALNKMNKMIVWGLFIILTAMQAMGNAYYAYIHLNEENYRAWIELFGLVEEDPIFQKRILSIVSGAILPLVALGFIKSLVDYIKPSEGVNKGVNEGVNKGVNEGVNAQITDAVTTVKPKEDSVIEQVVLDVVEKPINEITPEEKLIEDTEKKN